jgi:hypothetical protein
MHRNVPAVSVCAVAASVSKPVCSLLKCLADMQVNPSE